MQNAAWTILRRGIRRGIRSLRRERQWGTAIGALFGVLLLFNIVIVVLLGTHGTLQALRWRTALRLEMRPEAADQASREFLVALQDQPFAETVAFVTKEQAYERARAQDPELVAFIDEYGLENPFRDTAGVTLTTLDAYDDFRAFIEQPRWSGVVDPAFLTEVTAQERQVRELLRFTEAARSLAAAVLGIVTIVLLFVTIELVRRRALGRSEAVLVERLVGASPFATLVPFAAEACLLLWAAGLVSVLGLGAFLAILPHAVPALAAGGALQELSRQTLPLLQLELPLALLAEMLLLPLLAFGGAAWGLLPQLRKTTLQIRTM